MRKPWMVRLLLAVCLLAPLQSRTLHADERSEARVHYERGTALFDLGKYIEAAHEYEAAYERKNDPALLFNIGQAYRLANDAPSALRAYRAYVRRAGAVPNRAEVEARIAELEHVIDVQSQAAARPPTGVLKPSTTGPEPPVEPSAAPPPSVTPPPREAAPPPTAAVAVEREAPPARTPLYKKWWLWTAVGVVVAGVVVGVSVAATTPHNASAPPGAIPIRF